MRTSTSIQILESLANGIDPITGFPIPSDSPIHDPSVIRALFAAVRALRSQQDTEVAHQNKKPPNAGQPWKSNEDQQLLTEFHSRIPFDEIAQRHGRTRGAIVAHLVHVGAIKPNSRPIPNDSISTSRSVPDHEKWWRTERPRAGKPWTPEEDQKLRFCANAGLTSDQIAERLLRGTHAVSVRLAKLGISEASASPASLPNTK
jgi:hypothetical protein